MDIDSNMEMVGKRFPYYTKYEVCLELIYFALSVCLSVCVCDVCVCVYDVCVYMHVCPFLQVGFDDNGRISGIMLNMYTNSGYVDNDNSFSGNFLYGFIDNGLSSCWSDQSAWLV